MTVRLLWAVLLAGCGALLVLVPPGTAAPGSPAPSLSDVTAVLDQERPDATRIAALHATIDAQPPLDTDEAELADFYMRRAYANFAVGRPRDAIADTRKAIELTRTHGGNLIPLYRYLGSQLVWVGRPKEALQSFEAAARLAEEDVRANAAWVFHLRRWMVGTNLTLGNLDAATALVESSKALLAEARKWPSYAEGRPRWEAEVLEAEARLFEARGQFARAEAGFHNAQPLKAQSSAIAARTDGADSGEIQTGLLNTLAREGLAKMRQGRLTEAEADIRTALLGTLHSFGKYNHLTPAFIAYLAKVLAEQGRFAEAEKLVRTAIEICRTLGFPDQSAYLLSIEAVLGDLLCAEGNWSQAAEVYAAIDAAAAGFPAAARDALTLTPGHVSMLYGIGQVEAGVSLGRQMLARRIERLGPRHADTALARGLLATGLARLGNTAEAQTMFDEAIPILIDALRERPESDSTVGALRNRQVKQVIEDGITLAAASANTDDTRLEQVFRWADAVRGRAVQTAIVQASARAASGDDELSRLARHEQDLVTQIGAQFGLLTGLLAQNPDRRDERSVSELRRRIDDMRAEDETLRRKIRERFPQYAALIDPVAPSLAQVRAALTADEAFVSVLVGEQNTFVWVVPKQGRARFSAVPVGERRIDALVTTLRRALDPDAALVQDIPAYDFSAANEIYTLLLAPMIEAWAPARMLVVSVNGALGTLPFAVLTTERFTPAESKLLFSGYRAAPWLARSHAFSEVPSAAALAAIRNRPMVAHAREAFVGFGDPIFSSEDETARTPSDTVRSTEATTRGISLVRRAVPPAKGVEETELAQLPRLPDTALELQSIAATLGADPRTALHLEMDANEATIGAVDLARYRVVAFATHGLLPGDLKGLTEPALALTAPSIAGVTGDGLLTMSEILQLKLDADWVLLSACNSGAGASAGAEAASGLARAFFYAGARSALVTEWPIHSVSARLLMTDLFRRQAADRELPRAEALREAMEALIDGPGYLDQQGVAQFSYAHPMFWAPYVVIGDGGR